MRGAAPATPRPTWTQPHPARLATDHPPPGMPPPGQHVPTARAGQPTRHQPPLDLDSVLAYRQHPVPPRTTARPSRSPAKGSREGRRPSKPPHGDDEQQKEQPTRVALDQILTVNDANQLLRPHPECSGTAGPAPVFGHHEHRRSAHGDSAHPARRGRQTHLIAPVDPIRPGYRRRDDDSLAHHGDVDALPRPPPQTPQRAGGRNPTGPVHPRRLHHHPIPSHPCRHSDGQSRQRRRYRRHSVAAWGRDQRTNQPLLTATTKPHLRRSHDTHGPAPYQDPYTVRPQTSEPGDTIDVTHPDDGYRLLTAPVSPGFRR